MPINMAGIDYQTAPLAQREACAMTQAAAAAAARRLREQFALDGCLILSTCNRTELWVSGGQEHSLRPLLQQLFGEALAPLFVERREPDAVPYLFRLTCGMESQLFGEDQILGQVKTALANARDSHALDARLEVLFRTAITAAKAVKTQVRLSRPSAATAAVALLHRIGCSPAGQRCLVIGNGEMGRLAAQAMVQAGAQVSITRRAQSSHARGNLAIPAHCTVVDYDNRIDLLKHYPIIISATASPHCTLKWEDAAPALTHPHILLDLAVPRDIDSRLGSLPGISLYHIDDLALAEDWDSRAIQQAEQILQKYEREWRRWDAFRELAPAIGQISREVAQDVQIRLSRAVRSPFPDAREDWETTLENAVQKATAKRLYALKETFDPALWNACIAALHAPQDGKEDAHAVHPWSGAGGPGGDYPQSDAGARGV